MGLRISSRDFRINLLSGRFSLTMAPEGIPNKPVANNTGQLVNITMILNNKFYKNRFYMNLKNILRFNQRPRRLTSTISHTFSRTHLKKKATVVIR